MTWNIQKCYQTYNAKGGDHIWPFLAIWMTKEVTFCVLNTRGECVWGVLCLGSRAKKLLLGGPPSAIYVAVPPLSLMIFFDRYLLWCILRVILLQPTAEVDECVVECRRWWAVRGICPTWANSPHCGRTSNTFPFIFLPCILFLSLSHLQMYLSPSLSLRKLLTLRAHYLLLGKNISNHVYWTFESSL